MSDARRIQRLQKLIEAMKSGDDVANRDLKNVLTNAEWSAHELDIKEARYWKSEQINIPQYLKRYVDLLKIPDLLHARTVKMKNSYKRSRLSNKSESAYARALEYLDDVLSIDMAYSMWLDRGCESLRDNSYASISPDPTSVPRLYSSSSQYALGSKFSLHDAKRKIKLSTLESSLDILLNGDTSTEDTNAAIVLPPRFSIPKFKISASKLKKLKFD